MPKLMKRSESPEFFAKGGKGKMFGKGHASEAPHAQSGKESQEANDGARPDTNEAEGYGSKFKFAEGGGGGMFGKGSAGKKIPGISGKASQEG